MAYENEDEFYAQMDRIAEIELEEHQKRLKRCQEWAECHHCLYKGLCLMKNPIVITKIKEKFPYFNPNYEQQKILHAHHTGKTVFWPTPAQQNELDRYESGVSVQTKRPRQTDEIVCLANNETRSLKPSAELSPEPSPKRKADDGVVVDGVPTVSILDECNNEQCHWDSDECHLIKTEDPWSQCTVMVDGKSCQELFSNGVCDSECATTECLLDGKDCLPVCPYRLSRKWSNHFQNQKCDQKCNTQECLFDGGDCKSQTEVKLANGLLTFTVMLPERGRVSAWRLNWKSFLVTLGGLLNCIPIIEDVREIVESEEKRWNETVDLDVSDCTDLCITSSSEAKDILNIHYSRGSFPPYPYMVTDMSSLPIIDHKTV
ncbi:uncharacterized protein [Dysidea avara]|uniref:uncharacterized protein isoform X2 n=1 Tax=Dysidea avara TaxID=196820 RepID=UPI003325C619